MFLLLLSFLSILVPALTLTLTLRYTRQAITHPTHHANHREHTRVHLQEKVGLGLGSYAKKIHTVHVGQTSRIESDS